MFDPQTDPRLRDQILAYHVGEFLTDIERARLLGLPEGCRIRERAKILAREKLVLGNNVWIGEGAMLDAQGGLSIGENTQIGLNVMVWSHTSHMQALFGQTTAATKQGIEYKETKIGKSCFIAGPSVIAAGVTIGDRVLVGPFTLVDRDLPSGAVCSAPRDHRALSDKVAALEALVKSLEEQLRRMSGAQSA
jgi:acetyltransferase-like isoleucine patch superfamily enzyme